MHRSAFRKKPQMQQQRPQQAAPAAPARVDLDDIRAQIANISREVAASVSSLAKDNTDVTVPADIDKSLKLVHERLDRLERNVKEVEAQQKRMAMAFSNAMLKMTDKVEKIAGGEDSTFSLAHSLEKLIDVLSNRKVSFKRNADGEISEAEVGV